MLEIMLIPNLFRDILNNLIDSSDDGFNTQALAELMQIHILSDNIPSLGEREKGLNEKRDLLKNWLQAHQPYYETLSSSFDA